MFKLKITLAAATLALCFALNSAADDAVQVTAADMTFSIGVVPQQSAAKLAAKWVPLSRYLEHKTGIHIVFATAPDIPTFEQRLLGGEYDFAYMNPYHYVALHDSVGYQAMAKARDKKLKGIIVVRKDADINRLEDLDGSTLAFPSKAAFAASILARAELANRGIRFEPKYVSSHDSVYKSVAAGLYPAGGGIIRTLNSIDEKTRESLRILWKSPGSTPHAIAHHPRVDSKVVDTVQAALIELENTEAGRKILAGLKLKGIERANDAQWDDVRALNITYPIGTR